jgi:hypothetical protein
MSTFPKIHWGRILIGGFLAVGSVLTFVLANSIFFAQHLSRYAWPLASMLACFLFAFWVGQRVDAGFVLHGSLVGVVAIVIEFGLTRGQLGAWPYIVGQALSVACGAAGGLVAGRGRLFGTRKEEQRIVAVPYAKPLAIACGLLVGGFLFQRFDLYNSVDLSGWKLYQGVALLAGIGLAGLFDEAWLIAVIGLGIAPTLVVGIKVFRHPAESMWPIALPIIFFLGFPAPLIGGGISCVLTRAKVPKIVYIVALTGALVVGAFWPT